MTTTYKDLVGSVSKRPPTKKYAKGVSVNMLQKPGVLQDILGPLYIKGYKKSDSRQYKIFKALKRQKKDKTMAVANISSIEKILEEVNNGAVLALPLLILGSPEDVAKSIALHVMSATTFKRTGFGEALKQNTKDYLKMLRKRFGNDTGNGTEDLYTSKQIIFTKKSVKTLERYLRILLAKPLSTFDSPSNINMLFAYTSGTKIIPKRGGTPTYFGGGPDGYRDYLESIDNVTGKKNISESLHAWLLSNDSYPHITFTTTDSGKLSYNITSTSKDKYTGSPLRTTRNSKKGASRFLDVFHYDFVNGDESERVTVSASYPKVVAHNVVPILKSIPGTNYNNIREKEEEEEENEMNESEEESSSEEGEEENEGEGEEENEGEGEEEEEEENESE